MPFSPTEGEPMPKAVKFDRYGGVDVLRVVEVEQPVPDAGQVLVQVKAAGINPGDVSNRQGLFAQQRPLKFPSGQGSDFAGVVKEVGRGVTSYRAGDEVIGFTSRASQAEFVVVPADQLTRRPPHVSWEQAGALFVAGTTAYAAVRAVGPLAGQTLVVSGAAGGVGSIAVQLGKIADARVVIGLASETHHAWLSDHGVIPLAYGDGVADRIRAAAGGRVDAFVDTFGHGYVELALGLGVAPQRIDTTIDFAVAEKHQVKTDGSSVAASAEVLAQLAELIEAGRLEIPIAKVYRLADVQEAYRELERRHTLGKIVLVP